MPEPVGNTCPAINKVIGWVNEVLTDSTLVEKQVRQTHDPDKLNDLVHDLIYSIEGLANVEDILEEVRAANEALRSWGYDTESELDNVRDELENETNQLEQQIYALEGKLEEIASLASGEDSELARNILGII